MLPSLHTSKFRHLSPPNLGICLLHPPPPSRSRVLAQPSTALAWPSPLLARPTKVRGSSKSLPLQQFNIVHAKTGKENKENFIESRPKLLAFKLETMIGGRGVKSPQIRGGLTPFYRESREILQLGVRVFEGQLSGRPPPPIPISDEGTNQTGQS